MINSKILLKNSTATLRILFVVFLLYSCNNAHKEFLDIGTDEFLLLEMDIETLQNAYQQGTLSVQEVISLYIRRIEMIDAEGPALNAILTLNPDALSIAELLDQELSEGLIRGPLHGVPVVLKDNIDTYDKMPTTAGSRALTNSFPLADSYVAEKLRDAGAVILGKTNLSEWANFRGEQSTSGWSGLGGQTRNPFVLDRNPCGSSSGSAVAVSANLSMFAIGTETNGSIICPSHANGIVGLKPTLGLISRRGIIPIAYNLDVAGPMTRTVRDAAIVLGLLAGKDTADETTLTEEAKYWNDYTPFLNPEGLQGKRIGLFTGVSGINFKVDELMQDAVAYMESQGAKVIEVDQLTAPGTSAYAFQVMLYEYKDGLNRYFASLGEDAPIKTLEELIAFNKEDSLSMSFYNQAYLEMAQAKGDLNSADYLLSLREMQLGARENGVDKVMDHYELDAIIAPSGSPAWFTDYVNGDCYRMGSSSPAAHAGYPSITIPMGFVADLPVGISIFGRAWSEPVLLEIAYAYEQGTGHRRAPRFLAH